jgi:glucosamine kinase
MGLYLGIDGGGTKTRFYLGDERELLTEATTGGSNILRTGEAAVREALHAGIDQVCGTAKVSASDIQRVVAGMAGSSNEKVRSSLHGFFGEKLSAEVIIVGDMVIAHHAALEGEPGVLVNAGTGSIAYGRNAAGETARAGGWGFAISDEGSGHWIGRVAIAAAMRCFDTRKEAGYLHHLMAALGVVEPQQLAVFANSTANPDFAHVFPSVVTIADAGDTTARKILVHAGEELACLADAVLDRLFAGAEHVAIVATGGVFRHSDTVLESFVDALREHHPNTAVSQSECDPALGALMLARQPR